MNIRLALKRQVKERRTQVLLSRKTREIKKTQGNLLLGDSENTRRRQMNIVQKENMSLMQREDGYVNATALCKSAGKLVGNYLRNEQTKSFLDELSWSMQIRIDHLVKPVLTNVPNTEKGTYVHPKVAIHLAQWLSPKFAVFVTEVIFDFMNGTEHKKEQWEGLITPVAWRPSIHSRAWLSLMHRLYGQATTPQHINNIVFENALGVGAVAELKRVSVLNNNRPMYDFLTDEGRFKVEDYIKEIVALAETFSSFVELETVLCTKSRQLLGCR